MQKYDPRITDFQDAKDYILGNRSSLQITDHFASERNEHEIHEWTLATTEPNYGEQE